MVDTHYPIPVSPRKGGGLGREWEPSICSAVIYFLNAQHVVVYYLTKASAACDARRAGIGTKPSFTTTFWPCFDSTILKNSRYSGASGWFGFLFT